MNLRCKGCGTLEREMQKVLSLGSMPLANKLLPRADEPYGVYPLEIALCPACGLAQLTHVIPPENMFAEYGYLTSCSPPMVEQARELVERVMSRMSDRSEQLVVEIGSNDGYLLQHYVAHGVKTVGIDPAEPAATKAEERGVHVVREFFTASMAERMGPVADVVHAHNVMAHVPEVNDFVSGIKRILKPEGIAVIEVPDAARMVEGAKFDTVYHEHVYYFTSDSLRRLFERHGLMMVEAESICSHGGSLRLWVQHYKPFKSPEARESIAWDSLQSRADSVRDALRATIRRLRTRGRTVAGFGAAAKATVMLNWCDLGAEDIAFVADDTPTKVGKWIAGTGIPVVPTNKWLALRPDYTLVLAWNYAQAIAHQYKDEYKGRLFTPYILPTNWDDGE
jgi:SAM-dependent methyltransferase